MSMKQVMIGIWLSAFAMNPVFAGQPGTANHITVKTILASSGDTFTDPPIADLSKELQSVFRYSSYRLLAQSAMNLSAGQTGNVTLPGGRTLQITLIKNEGNRAHLRLEIFKQGQPMFQTVVQLLDRAAVTVGGPQHEGGYLLFNISNVF